MFKATEQQIAEWKKKHGRIFLLEFPSVNKAMVIAKPSRQITSLAFTVAAKDPFGMAQVVRDNCWIDGDEDLKTNDDYLVTINTKIDGIVGIVSCELKEL